MITDINTLKSLRRSRLPVRPEKERQTMPGRCRRYCPGANRCVLSGEVEHSLCCCGSPDCLCHSFERYEEEREQRKHEHDRKRVGTHS